MNNVYKLNIEEEEKQAIKFLKLDLEKTIEANECGLSTNDFKKNIACYKTILNLIEKQQKEIEELKLKIKNALEMIDDNLNHTALFNCADLILIEQELEDDEDNRL